MDQPVDAAVGWWLQEALAGKGPSVPAAIEPDVESPFDVVILGGGYTGLWTAWWLVDRQPGVRLAIVDRGICGGGPSGRNGGFVHGWWDQLPYLVERFGPDQALRIARLVDESVAGIGSWAAANGVEAWYRRGGYMRVSASPAQDGEWRAAVRTAAAVGVPEQYIDLGAEEVRARCASPVMRAGALMPNAATVQPARLARGLHDVLAARGVTFLEHTTASSVESATPLLVRTSRGDLRAEQVVLALNAWAASWPGFRTSLLSWGSHMLMTEPVPSFLESIGWRGGEAIADSRFTVHYFRTTPDGRVAFGAGVGAAGFGGRVDGRYDRDARAEARARDAMLRFFPDLAGAEVVSAWGGPIDISPDRLPMIGSRDGGRVHYAHGFSGNGVAPAHFAGRLLSAIVGDPAGELATLQIVNRSHRHFPPEPLRFTGARVVREALVRRDEVEDAGGRPSLILRAVAAAPRMLGYRFGATADD